MQRQDCFSFYSICFRFPALFLPPSLSLSFQFISVHIHPCMHACGMHTWPVEFYFYSFKQTTKWPSGCPKTEQSKHGHVPSATRFYFSERSSCIDNLFWGYIIQYIDHPWTGNPILNQPLQWNDKPRVWNTPFSSSPNHQAVYRPWRRGMAVAVEYGKIPILTGGTLW